MTDVASLLGSLVPLLFPLLVAVCAWLYHALTQRSPERVRDLVTQLASTVVPAMEQAYVEMPGAYKKQQASAALQGILTAMQIRVPQTLVDVAIEAAVYALNAEMAKVTEPSVQPAATDDVFMERA